MRLTERAFAEIPATSLGIESILAFLLRYCRDRVSTLRAALDSSDFRQYHARLVRNLDSFFRDLDDTTLFLEDVLSFRDELHKHANAAELELGSAIGDVIVARSFADAIDLALGERLADRFRLCVQRIPLSRSETP